MLLYFQVLKLNKSQIIEGLNGRVINLLSFDVVRFNNFMSFTHFLWKGPIEMIVCAYFIYEEIGYYGFIGVGLILCFVPIQSKWHKNNFFFFQEFNSIECHLHLVLMGKMTANYRYEMSRKTDSRIRVMNEIIQGIQTIKMYAWERPFADLIDYMRKLVFFISIHPPFNIHFY